jgi:hypothetical protein
VGVVRDHGRPDGIDRRFCKVPEKVKELVAKWEAWATRANVIPWIWKPEYAPLQK